MYKLYGKRLLDIIVAISTLLTLSPLLIILAVGVRFSSPGPAIFRQQRVGMHGRLFQFYKFRTMPVSTEDIPSGDLCHVDIRPFGKFLRRTNLDELPQLYNVLRGDMSLIGPRPQLPMQQNLLALRITNGALSCRPGLTGLAQVNSYDGMSIEQKSHYDGVYSREIKFITDFVIALKTIRYLLKPPPVY